MRVHVVVARYTTEDVPLAVFSEHDDAARYIGSVTADKDRLRAALRRTDRTEYVVGDHDGDVPECVIAVTFEVDRVEKRRSPSLSQRMLAAFAERGVPVYRPDGSPHPATE